MSNAETGHGEHPNQVSTDSTVPGHHHPDGISQEVRSKVFIDFINDELPVDPVANDQSQPMPNDSYLVQLVFHGLIGVVLNTSELIAYFLEADHYGRILVKEQWNATGQDYEKVEAFHSFSLNGRITINNGTTGSIQSSNTSINWNEVRSADERNSIRWFASPVDFLEGTPKLKPDTELRELCKSSIAIKNGKLRIFSLEGMKDPLATTGIPDAYCGWPNNIPRGVARAFAVEFYHFGEFKLNVEGSSNPALLVMNNSNLPLAVHFINYRCTTGAAVHFKHYYELYNNDVVANRKFQRCEQPGELKSQTNDRTSNKCLNEACPSALLNP